MNVEMQNAEMSVLGTAQQMGCLIDLTAKIVDIEPSLCTFLGYNSDTIIGENIGIYLLNSLTLTSQVRTSVEFLQHKQQVFLRHSQGQVSVMQLEPMRMNQYIYLSFREKTLLPQDVTERLYQQILAFLPVAIAVFDIEMRYIYANALWYETFRLNPENTLGQSHYALFPQIPVTWKEENKRCLAGESLKSERNFFVHQDGTEDWAHWEAHPWREDTGQIGGVMMFTQIITKNVEKESHILKVNRELTLLNKINDCILHTSNESLLLKECANIFVQTGAYKLAWFAYVPTNQLNANTCIEPLYASGKVGYVENLRFAFDKEDIQDGPAMRAIRNKQYAIVNHIDKDPAFSPWLVRARSYGFASVISLFLPIDGEQDLLLSLYSDHANAFDTSEVDILKRIIENLTYALKGIRNTTAFDAAKEALLKNYKELSDYKIALDESSIVSITDAEGCIKYVNKNFCKISEYALDELIGKNYLALNPGLNDELIPLIGEALVSGQIWKGEYLNRKKSGEQYWTYITVVPFFTMQGTLDQIVTIAADITQRRAYEEQLKLNDLIINSTDDAILSRDMDGIILSWNQGAERLFGFSASEALGQSIALIVPPDKLVEQRSLCDKISKGESVKNLDTVRLHKNGYEIPVSLSVSAIRDEKGNIIGGSQSARDISVQKNAEKAREQALYQLNERVKELTTLNECSQILYDGSDNIEETLSKLIEALPRGFQYPHLVVASLAWENIILGKYVETQHHEKLESDFKTVDGKRGLLQIAYTEACPSEKVGAFFEEEYTLVQMLAEMIATYLNRQIQRNIIEKSELNLQSIFNATENIYVLLDEQRRIILFNPAAQHFAQQQYKQTLNIGDNVTAVLPNDLKGGLNNYFEALAATNMVTVEKLYQLKEGINAWFLVNYSKIADANGKVLGYLIAVQDVTARKQQEEEKQRQLSLYEELLFIISHELRHEYAKLYSIIELVADLSQLDPQLADIIRHSRNTFEKLNVSIAKLNQRINQEKAK